MRLCLRQPCLMANTSCCKTTPILPFFSPDFPPVPHTLPCWQRPRRPGDVVGTRHLCPLGVPRQRSALLSPDKQPSSWNRQRLSASGLKVTAAFRAGQRSSKQQRRVPGEYFPPEPPAGPQAAEGPPSAARSEASQRFYYFVSYFINSPAGLGG